MVQEAPARTPDEFRGFLDANPAFVREALAAVRILSVNEHTREMFGASTAEELTQSLESVFSTPDTLPGFIGELEALFEGRATYRTTMRLRRLDGELIEVLLTMSFPPPESESGWVPVTLMDITDMEESWRMAQRRTRDLETLLYISSHDLREPLRGIQAFSRMVRDRYSDVLDEKGRDFMARILAGAERLDRLLEELLQLSRAQRLERSTTGIDGAEVVRQAMEGLQGSVDETGARVAVSGTFPVFQADLPWAVRALSNLISNALKFTLPGEPAHVEITPYREGNEYGISVRDHGPGVRPEHRERILRLFQRAVSRDVPGTGAGLAIAAQVAERHGGRVFVRDPEGGGAEFVLTFPLFNQPSRGVADGHER